MESISFIELKCQRCGGELKESGGAYECAYCGKKWQKQNMHGFTDMLDACEEAIRNQRVADIANLRRLLWSETHKVYVSNIEVEKLCGEILKYLPQDFYANFYLAACSGGKTALGDFLASVDVKEHYDDIPLVMDYVLTALKPEWVLGVSGFIEKIKDVDVGLYHRYRTRFEDEYQKIEECVFEPAFPRDAFIAYSSADMGEVTKLVTALEEEKLTCFVSARNMRHGSGSVERYDEIIRTAIDHCKVIVFVSSDNSRSVRCEAYKELDYVNKNCSRKPRVELVVKNYSGRASERFFEEFFSGLEYVTSAEDAAARVAKIIMGGAPEPSRAADTAETPAEVIAPAGEREITKADFTYKKICANPDCGAACDFSARFCPDCGNSVFYSDYGEYEKRLLKYCSDCGAENDSDSRFCASCGGSKFITRFEHLKKAERDRAAEAEKAERLRKAGEDFEIKNGALIRYKGAGGDVVIPDGVTHIYGYAFKGCNTVESVTIPASVTSIVYRSFEDCTSLKAIYVNDGNKKYKALNGNLYDYNIKTLVQYAIGKTDSVFRFPLGIKFIGSGAFSGCARLARLTIPDGVTGIGDGAFSGCASITSVNIPKTVTYVGARAFENCGRLKTIYCKIKKPFLSRVPRGWNRKWRKNCKAVINWNS